MKPSSSVPSTIDEYIAEFPPATQAILQKFRETVKRTAPEAKERISYAMPAFTLNGNLVYFAAMKHHIGFYPGAKAIEVFKDKLSPYKTSKGAIQFPYTQPMPWELVAEIVKFRVAENTKP